MALLIYIHWNMNLLNPLTMLAMAPLTFSFKSGASGNYRFWAQVKVGEDREESFIPFDLKDLIYLILDHLLSKKRKVVIQYFYGLKFVPEFREKSISIRNLLTNFSKEEFMTNGRARVVDLSAADNEKGLFWEWWSATSSKLRKSFIPSS